MVKEVPHQQLLEFLLRNINSGSLLTDEKPTVGSIWETLGVCMRADVCVHSLKHICIYSSIRV